MQDRFFVSFLLVVPPEFSDQLQLIKKELKDEPEALAAVIDIPYAKDVMDPRPGSKFLSAFGMIVIHS